MSLAPSLLAAMLSACGGAARQPAASVSPAPGPAPVAEPALIPRADITVCVVQDGELRMVPAQYDTRTGDTLVDGRPFAAAYPDTVGYAAGAEWYVNGEYITLDRKRFVKSGLPRVILPHELLTRAGEYRGVPLFAEREKVVEVTEQWQPSDIRYVPVRPGCEFQPYENGADVGAVRG
ncbi:MAG TPA: hypothetical protein VLK84_23725 [Longimicrobium sp.]|nr:hypothetical protein [Longimicrobium sp.]